MSWRSSYVVYRISPENEVSEVFHTEQISKAKYWMTYIAIDGDVLVRTPKHPKHSGATKIAEYWSHKEKSKVVSDLASWNKFLTSKKLAPKWPEEQLTSECHGS